MGKQTALTLKQRETGLKDLIKDGKEMGFNKQLLNGYEQQLTGIQEELKRDSEKVKEFDSHRVERGLIQK